MDKINKTINTEFLVSRTQGITPYINENGEQTFVSSADTNGNWGHIPMDIVISDDKTIKYKEMMKSYLFGRSQIRNSVMVKRITRGSDLYWVDNFPEVKSPFDCIPFGIEKIYNEGGKYVLRNNEEEVPDGDFLILITDTQTTEKYNNWWWNSVGEPVSENILSYIRDIENKYLGILNVPTDIQGLKVPETIHLCDIPELIDWFVKNEDNKADCCISEEWKNRGGDAMYAFLKENENLFQEKTEEVKGYTYAVPTLSLPLLITEDFSPIGVMETYEYEEKPFDNSLIESETYMPVSEMEPKYIEKEEGDVVVASNLYKVRSDLYFSSDNETLPGIFTTDNKIYRFVVARYDSGKYEKVEDGTGDYVLDEETGQYVPQEGGNYVKIYSYRWEGTPVEDIEDFKYIESDGYMDLKGNKNYKVATLINTAELPTPTEERYNDPDEYYHYLIKYDNHMTIPYIENELHNLYIVNEEEGIYSADYITSIEKGDGFITIHYLLGGEFYGLIENGTVSIGNEIENTGIYCYETYPFNENIDKEVVIDGIETTITCDMIDFETTSEIVSYDLNDSVSINTSNLNGMKYNDIWTSGSATMYPVFVNDSIFGMVNPPEINIDVDIDRGSTNVLERHFKICECNSFENLENYGNGELLGY